MTRFLRRLDHLPPAAALTLGIGVAVLPGVVLVQLPLTIALPVMIVLLVLAGWLAYSGEPIEVLDAGVGEPEPERAPPGWVEIPAGSFRMGSPSKDEGRYEHEGPVHQVRISAFLCMQHQVTRRLYVEVMRNDPGWPAGEADERPVNQVSWFDAVNFCNTMSERDGLTPYYQIDGQEVRRNRTADGYRLPTEAEWEYAARAGTTTRWSFGDDESKLGKHAWYDKNSRNKPHPVGQLEPNPWGLYDVHGNVLEWCWDWYDSYPAGDQVDPDGPNTGERRVLRGGAFDDWARDLRSANRNWVQPVLRFRVVGFRCVRASRHQH